MISALLGTWECGSACILLKVYIYVFHKTDNIGAVPNEVFVAVGIEDHGLGWVVGIRKNPVSIRGDHRSTRGGSGGS